MEINNQLTYDVMFYYKADEVLVIEIILNENYRTCLSLGALSKIKNPGWQARGQAGFIEKYVWLLLFVR